MMSSRLQRVGVVCGVVIGVVVLLALMLMPGQTSSGQGLPPTPAANALGWRTYTTAAPQWRYDPARWVPLSNALLSTSTTNAQLTLTFLGSGVSLHFATSLDGGSFSAQIDDQLPETLDTHSAGGAAGDAVWSKAVDPGVHTLTVIHHSGTLRLKSVAVQGDLLDARPVSPTQAAATRPPQVVTPQPPIAIASPVPSSSSWTTYQDTDPRLVYSDGTWQTFPVARANGGTLTGTADEGASLSIRFWGTAARVVYARGPEGGAFLARTKERLAQTGDAYGRAYSYGHTLTIEGLELGLHTLTFSDNDGAIWIEAVEIQGELLTPLPDESDLSLIFSDAFDAGISPAWKAGQSTAKYILATHSNGQAARLEGLGLSLRPYVLDTADYLLKAEIYVSQGNGAVLLGTSASGSYYLTIGADGAICFYQDTVLLATTITAPFSLGTWKNLEVFLWQGILRVEVDNQPLIEITIEQPVSPRITFDVPSGNSTFWVDQVEIWGPPISEATIVPTALSASSSLMAVAEVVDVDPPDVGLYLYENATDDLVLWNIEQDTETTIPVDPSIIYYSAATLSPTGTQIAALYWHWDSDLWQPESPHIVFFDASTAQAQFAIRINGPYLLESYNIKWSPALPDGSSWLLIEGEYADDPNSWYGPWGFLLLNYQDILAQVDANPGGCSIDVPCLVTATAIGQGANEELYSGTWSPDGQAIAYDVDALGDTTRASSTPIDSLSTRTPIVFPPGDHWWGIQWSPVDSNLFVAVDSSTDSKTLYTFTRDGTIRNQVTYPGVGESDSWPFWSPDGTRIGFSRWSSATMTSTPYLTNKDATDQTVPVSRPGNMHDWWRPPINFTNIRFFDEEKHAALKSFMFWMFWNETSNDRLYFGGDEPIVTSPSSPITSERDQISRELASFLVNEPYCQNGENQAAGEQPDTLNWGTNITRVEHCIDHRYMMAQTLINAFIDYERTVLWEYDPDVPEHLMGVIFPYGYVNFGGSIGRKDYELWNQYDTCQAAGYFSSWPRILPTRPTGTGEKTSFDSYSSLLTQLGKIEKKIEECGTGDACLEPISKMSVHAKMEA